MADFIVMKKTDGRSPLQHEIDYAEVDGQRFTKLTDIVAYFIKVKGMTRVDATDAVMALERRDK